MSEVTIREMDQNEDFTAWYWEHLEEELDAAGASDEVDQHYLILSNEIGDWVGGLRYWQRGGVAHLMDVLVLPDERHQGHAHRLLAAFEERAIEHDAHLAEFWTDDIRSEGLLAAMGWRCIFRRNNYIAGKEWALMEKRLAGSAG
jgi:GNAT superfamily N-acetyltransferase